MASILPSITLAKFDWSCPLFLGQVPAGFLFPATEYIHKRLSTDDMPIHDSAATYFVRAQDDSMVEAGISFSQALRLVMNQVGYLAFRQWPYLTLIGKVVDH